MNIEHMQKAAETVLERQIDDTVWDRFARSGAWEYEVVEVVAQLFEDAEPDRGGWANLNSPISGFPV